ncbi:Hypothetical protein PHPALM_7290 [Phytophthora palmivora]|uniref:Uncharacterized protein n=1 Tax=Phytophthora palmivora TaxID=4796 RepID=A0A2P4YCQ7_9STRA|nr:Hypothetical protein PHPALM_7290 [Phytophthora palmivora]
MTQLQPSRLSKSKSSDVLDARLKRLATFTSLSSAPVKRVSPAIAVAGLIIPPPPSVPPPDILRKQSTIDIDPDVTAKAVLREVTNEVDQVKETTTRSTQEAESLLRMLSDKYIHGQLSKLPGTPFVQLVRKKQKLTSAQREVLQNLLQLPEKQLLKLPKAQLELVHFAKRYDKLVKATPDQLRHLPIEHQQLVRSMQQQQKQLRSDDRS